MLLWVFFFIYKAYSDQMDAVVLRVGRVTASGLSDFLQEGEGSFFEVFIYTFTDILAHKQHRS